MERLQDVLGSIGVRHLYVFVDDFSELPLDAMTVLVDTILAPLNNWSNELFKFKVAAYPGRVYLGGIDPAKMDAIHLDTFRLYGVNDVSSMEEKAIDFTQRLLKRRFTHFISLGFESEHFCDTDTQEIYRQLFFASMGNPRILGHLLHNIRKSHVAYKKSIGLRGIQDAAARYYEEKVEPFFGIKRNLLMRLLLSALHRIFSLKELLKSIHTRARELGTTRLQR